MLKYITICDILECCDEDITFDYVIYLDTIIKEQIPLLKMNEIIRKIYRGREIYVQQYSSNEFSKIFFIVKIFIKNKNYNVEISDDYIKINNNVYYSLQRLFKIKEKTFDLSHKRNFEKYINECITIKKYIYLDIEFKKIIKLYNINSFYQINTEYINFKKKIQKYKFTSFINIF